MFYTRIVISGCTRFSVSGKYYIEVTPTAKVQMILGTNGSGKTTLAQLGYSPLPIDAKWMKPGGYWIKEGNFKGDTYRLEGKYGQKPTFTFIKNDEVLLEDGGPTMYLDLVKTHLGYTKWLHELLTGRIRFTELSALQRQDLLSNISNSDFTHAFKTLTKYKKLYQSYQSIRKFLQQRINEESIRLIDENEYTALNTTKQQLMLEYNELQSIQIDEPKYTGEFPVRQLYDALIGRIDEYLKDQPVRPMAESEEQLLELKRTINVHCNQVSGQIDMIEQEIMGLQQTLGVLNAEGSDLDSKREELARLNDEVNSMDDSVDDIPLEYLVEQPEFILNELKGILATIPSEKPDIERQIELERSTMEKEVFLRKCEHTVESIERELQIRLHVDHVECPKCAHRFQPGVDPSELATLEDRKKKGLAVISTVSKELDETREVLESYLEVKTKFDALTEVRRQWQSKYPGVFKYIDSMGGLNEGRGLLTTLHAYGRACTYHFKKTKLLERVERLKAVAEHIETTDKERTTLTSRLDQQGSVLYDLKQREKELSQQGRRFDNNHTEYKEDDEEHRKVVSQIDELSLALQDELNHIKHRVKQTQLQDVLGKIASIDGTLSEQESIRTLITEFETQLDDVKKKGLVTQEIIEAISPKTGIIAEQIKITIGGLIDGLNQLFQKIWGYPLEVGMSTVGDHGLDYKFPISDSDVQRDDVSEGSDSMLEMVNRAVVIMSYYSLDLMDYPLFLDEPGRTFDKVHKLNLIPLIQDLSDNHRFSQIVLISHSEDVQTAFPNSQTLITDDRNIDYPHPYNDHVNFEPPLH